MLITQTPAVIPKTGKLSGSFHPRSYFGKKIPQVQEILFDTDYRLQYLPEIRHYDSENAEQHQVLYKTYLTTEFEQTYDNFTVALAPNIVTSDFNRVSDLLEITIINKNHKPFFLWHYLFSERSEDGVRTRVPRLRRGMPYWAIVGFDENAVTLYYELIKGCGPFVTDRQAVDQDDPMFPELIPGEYRIAVYVGKEILYAPFTVTEE